MITGHPDENVFCEKILYVTSIDEEIHIKIFKPVKKEEEYFTCGILAQSKKGTMDFTTDAFGADSVQAVVHAFMYLGAKMFYFNKFIYKGDLSQIKGQPEPFPDSFGFIKNWPDDEF